MRADLMLKTDHHVIRSIKQLDRDEKRKAKTNRLLDSSFSRVSEGMKDITRVEHKREKKKSALEEIEELLDEDLGEDNTKKLDIIKTKTAS